MSHSEPVTSLLVVRMEPEAAPPTSLLVVRMEPEAAPPPSMLYSTNGGKPLLESLSRALPDLAPSTGCSENISFR
jgi:hypothetical protein